MKLIPIYFDGDINVAELRAVLEAGGLHVRAQNNQLVCSRIPPFLRLDAAPTKAPANVVQLKRRAAR